jgi:hypothetical protein
MLRAKACIRSRLIIDQSMRLLVWYSWVDSNYRPPVLLSARSLRTCRPQFRCTLRSQSKQNKEQVAGAPGLATVRAFLFRQGRFAYFLLFTFGSGRRLGLMP